MSLEIRGRIFQKTSCICAARLEDKPSSYASSGTPFVQANFSAITYSVIDTTTGQPVSSNGVTYSALPMTISSVIYDTLQNWDEDSRGCNFLATISPDAFPLGNHEYAVEVKFTLTDGRVGRVVFTPTTEKVWSA